MIFRAKKSAVNNIKKYFERESANTRESFGKNGEWKPFSPNRTPHFCRIS